MSDYVNARQYAELHGLNVETVKARIKRKQIPFIRFGSSVMIDKNEPWVERSRARKPKEEVERAKAIAEVDSKILHIEITRAYYVAVCDNSGKELASDFTFLNKQEAEALGKKLKAEVEGRGNNA